MICQLGKGAAKGTSEHNFVKQQEKTKHRRTPQLASNIYRFGGYLWKPLKIFAYVGDIVELSRMGFEQTHCRSPGRDKTDKANVARDLL